MAATILLDMRATLLRPTGVGKVARELAAAMARQAPEQAFTYWSNSRRDRLPAAGLPANVRVADTRVPHRLLDACWRRLRWPPVESLAGPCDVAHAFEPLPLPARRARTVATVHDLFFLHHPELTDPAETAHLAAGVRRLLPRADRVVAVSEHVRQQAIAELALEPARVVTVPNGLRPDQHAAPTGEERSELRKRLRLPNSFLLYVGTIEHRKNLAALVRALQRLRERRRHDGAKLLVAGRRGFGWKEQEHAIARANITTEVRILDYLADADIKILMALARLVVVPSLDEGFSLPLVEAMALGTPVAASRRGAIPEVAGDAAVLFDPDDAEEMDAAIDAGLNDEATRTRLAAAGPARARAFSWEASAAAVLGMYRELRAG